MNKKKAKVIYKQNYFEIIEEGDYVLCAITGREIPLQNFYREKSLYNLVAFQKSREFYKRNPFKFFFRKKSSPKFSQISASNLTS